MTSSVASTTRPGVRRGGGILLAVGIVCLVSSLDAQDVTDPSLKAAIVYNIAKFTEWPQDALPANTPFMACVAGDSAAGRELKRVANGRSLDARPIVVVPLSESTPARSCHLLFLAGMPRDEARRVVSSLGMSPVLTITDIEGLTDAGAIVSLFPEAGRTRFDVDLGVAMRSRLQLSARLLALASQVRNGR